MTGESKNWKTIIKTSKKESAVMRMALKMGAVHWMYVNDLFALIIIL